MRCSSLARLQPGLGYEGRRPRLASYVAVSGGEHAWRPPPIATEILYIHQEVCAKHLGHLAVRELADLEAEVVKMRFSTDRLKIIVPH